MELVLKEGSPKRLLHLALTSLCLLPAGRAHEADDLFNVVDDALHDDRCVLILNFLEEFGEGALASLFVFFCGSVLLGDEDVVGDVEQQSTLVDRRPVSWRRQSRLTNLAVQCTSQNLELLGW